MMSPHLNPNAPTEHTTSGSADTSVTSATTERDPGALIRERLQTTAAAIFEREARNPAASSQWLALQLQILFDEICDAWATHKGTRHSFDVTVEDDARIAITEGRLKIALTHRTSLSWQAERTALHGEHLAACLAAWPAFASTPPAIHALGEALGELRLLLATFSDDAPYPEQLEHANLIADLLNRHPHPIVQELAACHMAQWPLHMRLVLDRHQHQRFAYRTLSLMRAQALRELRSLFEAFARSGDAFDVADALNAWFARQCPRWSFLRTQDASLFAINHTMNEVQIHNNDIAPLVSLQHTPSGWCRDDQLQTILRAITEPLPSPLSMLSQRTFEIIEDDRERPRQTRMSSVSNSPSRPKTARFKLWTPAAGAGLLSLLNPVNPTAKRDA